MSDSDRKGNYYFLGNRELKQQKFLRHGQQNGSDDYACRPLLPVPNIGVSGGLRCSDCSKLNNTRIYSWQEPIHGVLPRFCFTKRMQKSFLIGVKQVSFIECVSAL